MINQIAIKSPCFYKLRLSKIEKGQTLTTESIAIAASTAAYL